MLRGCHWFQVHLGAGVLVLCDDVSRHREHDDGRVHGHRTQPVQNPAENIAVCFYSAVSSLCTASHFHLWGKQQFEVQRWPVAEWTLNTYLCKRRRCWKRVLARVTMQFSWDYSKSVCCTMKKLPSTLKTSYPIIEPRLSVRPSVCLQVVSHEPQ